MIFSKIKSQILGIKYRWFERGFSLVELLITIALFLMLAGLGMGSYVDYYRSSQANIEIDSILTLVKRTRSRALKNADGASYGVNIDVPTRTITGFKSPYQVNDPQNQSIELNQVQINSVDLQPNPGSSRQILFEPKTGKTQNTGSITLESNGSDYILEINAQGLID